MKTLILICALGTLRQDCSIETAAVVIQGPDAASLAQCGFLGQAYLADTALAAYVEDGHYLKILCTSGDRPASSRTREILPEAKSTYDDHPSD
ncbi:MAG: hypothetical protein ACRBM6_28415 [Geminicoccales bacterium]